MNQKSFKVHTCEPRGLKVAVTSTLSKFWTINSSLISSFQSGILPVACYQKHTLRAHPAATSSWKFSQSSCCDSFNPKITELCFATERCDRPRTDGRDSKRLKVIDHTPRVGESRCPIPESEAPPTGSHEDQRCDIKSSLAHLPVFLHNLKRTNHSCTPKKPPKNQKKTHFKNVYIIKYITSTVNVSEQMIWVCGRNSPSYLCQTIHRFPRKLRDCSIDHAD